MTQDRPPAPSEIAHTLDARGLACPMPLLKAKQALASLEAGQLLKVAATDRGSVRDFHTFCELSGHILHSFQERDGVFEYILQKAKS